MIRMIDADGHEIKPARIEYLGPDPEDGTHHFQAWFDVEPPARPRVTIGVMPGRTTLRFRFLPMHSGSEEAP